MNELFGAITPAFKETYNSDDLPRVRISVTTTSKGLAQRDITVEAHSVEEAESLFRQANDSWKKVVDELGIPIADPSTSK